MELSLVIDLTSRLEHPRDWSLYIYLQDLEAVVS